MSSIFDPGKKARQAAQGMAEGGLIDNVSSSDSVFGGGNFADGRFTSTQGQLGQMMTPQIMQQMGNLFGQDFGMGALNAAGQDALGGLGPLQTNQAQTFQAPAQQQFQSGLMGNLFSDAQKHLDILGKSPEELGAGQLDIARQIAAPEEQRARVGQQSNLFAQGRMGTTGGAGQQQALMEAQNMADLQRQQMAFQQGQAIQGQAGQALSNVIGQGLGLQGMGNQINAQNFGQALQGSQQNEFLRQGQFGRDYQTGGFNAQRALDRFGVGQNIFNSGMQASMAPWQQLGMGMNAMGQIQNFGLNQFNTGLNTEIARSNSYGQGANTMAQTAASTPSPIMDLATGVMGAAGSAGGFSNLFSDERLKDDLEFISEDGKGNRWYTWTWNSQAKLLGVNQPTFGVIAQEVRKYNPAAVAEGPQGFLTVNYGAL
jgi:hypothetical protein